jgi:hypothetical protein
MDDGIWTGDSYILDMSTLGDLAGPGGIALRVAIEPRLNSSSGCTGACRFEFDVAEEAL